MEARIAELEWQLKNKADECVELEAVAVSLAERLTRADRECSELDDRYCDILDEKYDEQLKYDRHRAHFNQLMADHCAVIQILIDTGVSADHITNYCATGGHVSQLARDIAAAIDKE
jgi:chromosome segregation ATPase